MKLRPVVIACATLCAILSGLVYLELSDHGQPAGLKAASTAESIVPAYRLLPGQELVYKSRSVSHYGGTTMSSEETLTYCEGALNRDRRNSRHWEQG